jgi:hypothetical protein
MLFWIQDNYGDRLMKATSITFSKPDIKTVVYDLIAVSIVTLTPALSHTLSIPIYYFDPMRIILLLSVLYTSRANSYLLTLVLPIFSFIISEHPVLLKSWLISSELTLNIFLFFYLTRKINNTFAAVLLSIIISKIYYYTLKFSFVSMGLIDGEIFSTPVIYQVIVFLALTLVIGYFFKKKKIAD